MPQDNLFLNKNRVAIFAFYNKQAKVLDYVLSYLKYLKEVCSKIVFVADCELSDTELKKLEPYVCHVIAMRHGEYDFGSYKRGLNYAKDNGLLDDLDELVLCNDASYCVSSLVPAFNQMEDRACDFWAMTASKEHQSHLQSYFLVFKKQVVNHPNFFVFFNEVGKKDSFWSVVSSYELPLKDFYESLGFKGSSLFSLDYGSEDNPTYYPIECIEHGVPLIKRKLFSDYEYLMKSTSVYKTVFYLKNNYPKAYKDVLDGCSSINVAFLLYKITTITLIPHVKHMLHEIGRFIYRKDVSRRGLVRHRFFTVPLIMYRKHDHQD